MHHCYFYRNLVVPQLPGNISAMLGYRFWWVDNGWRWHDKRGSGDQGSILRAASPVLSVLCTALDCPRVVRKSQRPAVKIGPHKRRSYASERSLVQPLSYPIMDSKRYVLPFQDNHRQINSSKYEVAYMTVSGIYRDRECFERSII